MVALLKLLTLPSQSGEGVPARRDLSPHSKGQAAIEAVSSLAGRRGGPLDIRGVTLATALVLVLVLVLGFFSYRVNRRFMCDCARPRGGFP